MLGADLRPAELEAAPAVGRTGHRDVGTDTVEPVDAVGEGAFDGALALELEAELEEKGDGGGEIADDDVDVVRTYKCHRVPGYPAAGRRRA